MASTYAMNQKEAVCYMEKCSPEREAAVVGAVRMLGFARERMIKIATELESRLDPVLRAEDRVKSEGDAMRNPCCSLEGELQKELSGLESAEYVLTGILHRLEI